MKLTFTIFYQKNVSSYSSSNSVRSTWSFRPTLIQQTAKTIKEMKFGAPTSLFNKPTTASNFNPLPRPLRLALSLILLPLCFIASVSSCSQPEAVAPEVNLSTEVARRMASGIVNTDNFENGKFGSFWIPELRTATAGQVTTANYRSGTQAMRFSWKPSQYDGTNPTLHSELATSPLTNGETERWYGYSSYMPSSSMADEDQTVIVSQWHGIPDPGFDDSVPPLCIEIKSNQLKLFYAASNKPIIKPLQPPTSSKRIELGAAVFNRWVDYVVHIKWDPTGTTGELQIWQDGTLLVNEQNISIGYLQQRKPYWKCGLYCWTGKSKYEEKVILYDDVRIGNALANYDTVKPGQSANAVL